MQIVAQYIQVWLLPVIPRIDHDAVETSWPLQKEKCPNLLMLSLVPLAKESFCCVQEYSFLHFLSAVLQEMHSGVAPLLLFVYHE